VELACSADIQGPGRLQSVLVLLTGSYGPDNELFEPTVASIAGHPFAVITYLLSLYAFAAGLGYGAHKVVREKKLDRKTRLLRFRNEWYYLLSGEVLEWREFAEARQAAGAPPINFEEDIDGVYLTAVVDLAEGSFLYRGVVRSFWFDKTVQFGQNLIRTGASSATLCRQRGVFKRHSRTLEP
jgi:hypothetical protein